MNAIKSLFAASIFIGASAANATVWEITATGSHYYSYAGDLSVVYNGVWDDSANIGSWKGVGTIGLFSLDGHFSQNFAMNELTGSGTLQSMTGCTDIVNGAVCDGLTRIFVGSMRNNSNAFDQYAATKPSHTGTGFVPSTGGSYVWSFYLEDLNNALIDPDTGDTLKYWTKYDLNVTLNSVCITPEVPVPAAVWLFGSSLLALASRGRRRALAQIN
jgi:hypothetical protein